jgi:DNA gyrase subunit B
VEGDSALGACKQARDSAFQAVMPVRGKILNCLKADLSKVFKSEIITDLIKILGCGVEVSGKAVKGVPVFNIDNLRWNKVIICTDADFDGFQIRTLILTMIYALMPTLIYEGKVYIAESPLYEITCGKDTYFAYTEKEKNEALNEIGDKKYTIQRSKGLGENEAEMMSLTTMNPATRRLIQINMDEAEETLRVFEMLEGDDIAARKKHIAEEGHKYIDLTDVS